MSVFERGYRAYDGPRQGAPAWVVILREHLAMARRHRGISWMGRIVAVIFLATSVEIYVTMGLVEQFSPGSRGSAIQVVNIDQSLRVFYNFCIVPIALAAMILGSGLITDDMRTRALPLFLVRPLTPASYMLGKALVIPLVLVVLMLVPGLMLYLLAGLWQPPGETLDWLGANSSTLGRSLRYFATTTAYFTGLMLFASSLTSRRGTALAIGAAAFFAGPFLSGIGRFVGGTPGDLMRALDVLRSGTREFRLAASEFRDFDRARVPSDTAVWAVALALLLIGLIAAWRRARNVEVTG